MLLVISVARSKSAVVSQDEDVHARIAMPKIEPLPLPQWMDPNLLQKAASPKSPGYRNASVPY